MEQLEDLMARLARDSFSAVTIYDRDTSKAIYNNITHAEIKEQFGTPEVFFETLFKEGHTRLTLHEKRKNGNAFKIEGAPFEVTFSEMETPKEVQVMEKSKKKKKKKKKSSGGLMGLGIAEIFDLKLQAHDRDELARKLEESERQNKELRAKNEELTEEKLQKKYTKESNDSLNNMLLGVVKQAPLILQGLGFNVPAPNTGLAIASPEESEEEQNYSEAKKSFLQSIKTLDDDTINLLWVIYQKISENTPNNTFSQELFVLLQNHQMVV
jgi:hypothetical protein